jgi:chromosomal replication initiation ATPase DnaA
MSYQGTEQGEKRSQVRLIRPMIVIPKPKWTAEHEQEAYGFVAWQRSQVARIPELTEKALARFKLMKRPEVNQELLTALICRESLDNSLDYDMLVSESRRSKYASARWRVMQALRDIGYGVTAIGRAFDLDHTTIIHGLAKLQKPHH